MSRQNRPQGITDREFASFRHYLYSEINRMCPNHNPDIAGDVAYAKALKQGMVIMARIALAWFDQGKP